MDNSNMNEVIKQIISIDDEAKKIAKASSGENIDELVKKELDRRKSQIDADFTSKEQEKIEENKKSMEKIKQEKKAEIDNKIKKLEQEYQENEEKIISKVFTRITKI